MTYNDWLQKSCVFQQVVAEIKQLERSITTLKGSKNRWVRWDTRKTIRNLRLRLYKMFVDKRFCGTCVRCLETRPEQYLDHGDLHLLILDGDPRSYNEL